ncbi:MAG: S8 family serine peptidase [Candidatus Thermoplasmatota archaeon]
MTSTTPILLTALLLLAPLALALPGIGVPEKTLAPGDYIIGFFKDPFLKPGQTYMGERIIAVDHDLVFIIVHTDDYPLFHARVMTDENVRYVELDDPTYAHLDLVPNDAQYNAAGHWGSKKIGAQTAWDRTTGSTAVKVAMIDSGIFATHEDVVGSRLLAGWDFVNNDGTPNDESGCSYHGSHTTGTAGATINNGKGIAGMSQHTILPIKGLGYSAPYCTASDSQLVNALKYAGDQGAQVSSNSWGGGPVSSTINNAIQYSYDRGVIFVAAAGNSGPCTNCVGEPWKSKASIVTIVASTTETDGQSSFSSEGAQIDVAAPGSNILSLGGGVSTYQTMSGTSMATPHVAGTAALIKAVNPSWTFSQVDSQLKSTALDLGTAGFDQKFGYGRIRADQAVGAPTTPACSDGIDNDGDGLTDYPADPGCTSTADTDEYNAASCSGGPANNCFAAPTTVPASGGQMAALSTTGATTETGEPAPCGSIGATVWYTWTPTTGGSTTVETVGPSFDTVVAVYTGSSLTALTNVGCNDDIASGNTLSKVTFTATAGTTYRIQAGGYSGATGTLNLKVTAPAACSGPTGNCFSTAVGITSVPYSQSKSTSGATLETSEPRPCGSIGATVWYTYTPSTSGSKTTDTMGSGFDTVLAVYTGSSLTGLTNVGCNDDISGSDLDSRVTWTATAGTTYRIQVGGYNSATGSLVFHES